jgi:peptidoglycan/LPS O-acetylase OafA/YrhL
VISGITWSLEVEIQFYALVPVLACVFAIRRAAWRRMLLAGALLISGICSLPLLYTPAQLSILYYFNFFLAGLWLCDLYTTRGNTWEKSDWRWDVVAAFGWPLLWMPFRSVSHVLSPLLIIILCISTFRGTISRKVFSSPWLTQIGGMCYTIYLYHWLAMSSLARLTRSFHLGSNFVVYFLLQCVMILPFILLVSVAFYLLIERPCMNKDWPGELWARLSSLRSRRPNASKAKNQTARDQA